MNRIILMAVAAMLLFFQGHSQGLSDKTMTFYGIDFSKSKMVGEGFNDPVAIKDRIFAQWNGLFMAEADKYDLQKYMKKDKVELDFSSVEADNKTVDANSLVTFNDYKISDGDAESVLSRIDTKGASGLGCVFVVESFNKTKVLGTIHVIFFDKSSKKVILHKKMEEAPGGFGVKNYWAKCILLTLEDIKSQMSKWQKGK